MWSWTHTNSSLSAASPAVPERLFIRGAAGTLEAAAQEAQNEVSALYAERAHELLTYAVLMVRDEELARDALQEAFMRYFVARAGGESIRSPRAWLYRVLHNYLLDRLRESRTRNESALEQCPAFIDGRQDVEGAFLHDELLAKARTALTRREFDCFSLRAQGLPYEEIAAELNLRSGTVGALISRAVRKIRRLFSHGSGGAA